MKKLLVVGVIVLFLGLACAPSINANISRDNELVEITTEICGLGGGKHTVQLTKDEAEEVDRIFANIRQRLNESTSREEAKEIFNEAVVELDKYGLLGRLSVEQAQMLVTGGYQNSRVVNLIRDIYNKKLVDSNNSNFLCLISGESIVTSIIGPCPLAIVLHMMFTWGRHVAFSNFFWYISYLIFKGFGAEELWEKIATPIGYLGFYSLILREVFWFSMVLLTNIFPIKIGSFITFGFPDITFAEPPGPPHPAEGEIVTFGLAGKKIWEGEFFGEIAAYLGVVGFTGLKITKEYMDVSYFGSALWVKLDRDPIGK